VFGFRPEPVLARQYEHTLLTSATGRTATLGSLAQVINDPGETEILERIFQRLVQVTARLEGVDMGSGVAAVQKAVSDMPFTLVHRVEYGGLYEEDRKSSRDLMMVLLVALLLCLPCCSFEFRTFSAPTAILGSALLSTFGGFLALLVTGTTLMSLRVWA